MVPGELVAPAHHTHEIARQDRRPAGRVHVLEMRHPVPQQRAQRRAEQPRRVRHSIPEQPRAGGERQPEAVADVVLAVGRHWHVRGQHEGAVAGCRHAVHQGLDACGLAREVGLIPTRSPFPSHILQRDQRRGAEDHRHASGERGARQHDVCAVGTNRANPHGGDPKRRRVLLAEQSDGLATARHVCQHARNKTVFSESGGVAAQRGPGFGGSGNEAMQHPRQVAASGGIEVIKRQEAVQAPACGSRRVAPAQHRGSGRKRQGGVGQRTWCRRRGCVENFPARQHASFPSSAAQSTPFLTLHASGAAACSHLGNKLVLDWQQS